MSDRHLRRKWTFRAHGRQVVLVKHANERSVHVVMKALLWALYLPTYPTAQIETRIGDRYKPDVVALNPFHEPTFWGEAGQVSVHKIETLLRRYRHTHFAFAKWEISLSPLQTTIDNALRGVRRTAPIDLLRFDQASLDHVATDGTITLDFNAIEWRQIAGETMKT